MLEPLQFFDARPEGLQLLAEGESSRSLESLGSLQSIVRFVRTPDGDGLAVLRADGSVETWTINSNGEGEICCSMKGGATTVDQLVVLAHGRSLLRAFAVVWADITRQGEPSLPIQNSRRL